MALDIRARIEEFKPYIPLIQGLRNPGMQTRHWDMLSNEININVRPKATLTFAHCLEMNLQDHIENISKVAEVAGKEYAIEQVGSHQQCWALFPRAIQQAQGLGCILFHELTVWWGLAQRPASLSHSVTPLEVCPPQEGAGSTALIIKSKLRLREVQQRARASTGTVVPAWHLGCLPHAHASCMHAAHM